GAAFLGLTVGCARCHDHKIDPILQKDYYRLQAYLASTQEYNVLLMPAAEKEPFEAKWKTINAQIDELRVMVDNLQGAERRAAVQKVHELEKQLPPPPPPVSP